MIIKIEKQNGIDIIYVRADIPDEEMEKLKNKLTVDVFHRPTS